MKDVGFLASRVEEFNPGLVMRLDHSELLCNEVLLKYKGDRDLGIRSGEKEYPFASVSNGITYSLISYCSESKEYLEVLKTSLDLLP